MSCDIQKTALDEKLGALTRDLQEASEKLEEDVREEAGEIDPECDTTGPDVWIGLDIDISWKPAEFYLDLPEIRLVDQKWVLDLPQVQMKDQAVIFHTPSVRMKTVRGPDIPEVVCKMVMKQIGPIKTNVPECTTRMKATYLDIPETFMQEQRIVILVPEFRMGRTEMILGVPEFTMKTQRFVLHLPEVTVKNIRVEAEKARRAGEALAEDARRRGEELRVGFAATAKAELGSEVGELFACYRHQLEESKKESLVSFESSISGIQAAIASMVSNRVPDDHDQLVAARGNLVSVTTARQAFVEQIQEGLTQLVEQETTFFDRLVAQQ